MVATAERVDELEMFADFVAGLTLENGRAMELEHFQRALLTNYFQGTRETLVLAPKKNGKTSLIAALGIWHLLVTEDAECVIAAAARDQAQLTLRQAAGFVRRSAPLRERLQVKQREIVHRTLGGRLRVLASDTDTADGVIPTLGLVDELGRHKSAELYGLFADGLAPRDGQLVTISTAGDDDLSPLGRLRSAAYRLPVQRRDGAYRHASSEDGSFCLHEWALDADQDLDDLDLVKSANPASWMTVERLRERRDSPSTTSWQWARFACGVWVHGESSAIGPADWDALALPGSVIPDGSPVFIGLDLAWKADTTALVPLWWASASRRVIGDPTILVPPEGGMLDDRDIFAALRTLAERYRVSALVYDPNAGGQALCQQVSRELGLQLIEHSQRDSAMSLADGRLLEAIRRKELVHSGHEDLRGHVLNAIEKSVPGGAFRFARPRHGPRRPTDALTALSMCHSVAVAGSTKPVVDNSWYML